jgi:segregation and condensation protein A
MAVKPKLTLVASNAEMAPPEPAAVSPQQVEMPFAMVHGEPVTQLPKDLYIPPQALEVFLEAFEGPLDLLLYMIRRQGLNILDIPIAEITKQYMDYIGLMQELQLELAGEYMVMAATLAEIKSRMLLPRATDPNNGEESDPRADLVRRLQEYERFKVAAENIDRLPRLERDTWVAAVDFTDRKSVRPVPQVALQEMMLAFRDVVKRAELFAHHHVQRERLSVRARMSDILAALERSSFVAFVALFRVEEGRAGVTVTFVAILELMREGLIEIVQTEPYAPLHVRGSAPNRGLRLVAGNDAVADGDSAGDAGADVEMASAEVTGDSDAASVGAQDTGGAAGEIDDNDFGDDAEDREGSR